MTPRVCQATSDAARLSATAMGAASPEVTGGTGLEGWLGRGEIASAFQCEVRGTVGAGDATIGGFLSGLLRGLSLAECCTMACAVGAASVEGAEAANAIPPLAVEERCGRILCVLFFAFWTP